MHTVTTATTATALQVLVTGKVRYELVQGAVPVHVLVGPMLAQRSRTNARLLLMMRLKWLCRMRLSQRQRMMMMMMVMMLRSLLLLLPAAALDRWRFNAYLRQATIRFAALYACVCISMLSVCV